MNKKYFDIERDKHSTCFCQACLVGRTATKQSPDPRYCQGCYESLLKEAEMLSGNKRPAWIPKPRPNAVRGALAGEITDEKPIPVVGGWGIKYVHFGERKNHSGQN